MNTTFSMPPSKGIFNKYFLYFIFTVLIVLNILIFPDLLNHKDFKFNDMSYLLPTADVNTNPNSNANDNGNILNDSNDTDASFLNNDKNADITENTDNADTVVAEDENENDIHNTSTNSFYLFLILSVLFIIFGIYIYKNYSIIKTVFSTKISNNHIDKNHNVNLNSGYELLEDY